MIELDEALDEEGIEKKDLVLEALQRIKTSDFTELKSLRVPTKQIAQIITFTGRLLLGTPCDVRKALQDLISKPKVFIEMSVVLEDRLTASHLLVLRDIRAA